jgi:Ca2+/Na+ antiporter|eukprot:COSAG06_NODE_3383_length_5424_cov_4.593518_2_plen_63_part_00
MAPGDTRAGDVFMALVAFVVAGRVLMVLGKHYFYTMCSFCSFCALYLFVLWYRQQGIMKKRD